MKREGNEHPLEVMEELLFWSIRRNKVARLKLRNYYGIDLYQSEPCIRVVYPEFVPKEVEELLALLHDESGETAKRLEDRSVASDSPVWGFIEALVCVMFFDDVFMSVKRAMDKNYPLQEALNGYEEACLHWSAGFCGMLSTDPNLYSKARISVLTQLAGWVASRISLTKNRRLKGALSNDRDVRPFDALLQELSSATYIEWCDGGEVEELLSLPRRVALRLEKLGREADIKQKVVDQGGDLEAASSYEDDIEEDIELQYFEAKEAARQELATLTKKAGLSNNEQRVLEFDLQSVETKDIAREMDVNESTIKTYRKRYRDKMFKAAAG